MIDVPHPYREAIGLECARRVSEPGDSTRAPSHDERPSLCVVAISGDDDPCFEQVQGLQKLLGSCPLVVLATRCSVELVVRLMRIGVADVIELPVEPMKLVESCVRHYVDARESSFGAGLVGDSASMLEVRWRIDAVARVTSNVLIQGETGTGKGLVARAIHRASESRDSPFVHVDCAALAPTLVESELFGHERGAFTGAASLRRGRFELAGEGTIFLDEVSEIEPRLQSKLLRVIEDRTFERVGGTHPLPLEARIVAASNRDLEREVRRGSFRGDLYFRLNVLSIKLAPLRERLEDIPLLVALALRRTRKSQGVPMPRIGQDFCAHLTDHLWPGNVRELLNLIERAVVEHRPEVLEPDVLEGLLAPSPVSEFEASPQRPAVPTEDTDQATIVAALIDTGGNVSRSARRLGLPRGTLRYKIKRYGLADLIPTD